VPGVTHPISLGARLSPRRRCSRVDALTALVLRCSGAASSSQAEEDGGADDADRNGSEMRRENAVHKEQVWSGMVGIASMGGSSSKAFRSLEPHLHTSLGRRTPSGPRQPAEPRMAAAPFASR
jgi:hypothetical protein